MKIEEKIQKLQEASSKEGTEIGEYWEFLINMRERFEDYSYTKEFKRALDWEVEMAYRDFRDNYEITKQKYVKTHIVENLTRKE